MGSLKPPASTSTTSDLLYFALFTDASSSSDYIASDKFNGPSWRYHTILAVEGTILFWHLPGRTEKNHKKTSARIAGLRVEILTQDLRNTKKEC
jgi:hypothetical protein